ncbi:MAG: RNA polymerase sigma factor [Ignavibacteria bacterium]
MPPLQTNVPEDSELTRLIKEGNEEAFKNLFCKYFKVLVRYAWYRTNSIELSRDLVQEIFFNVWIKRNLLNPQKSIKAYLYKSLINSIIDQKKLSSSKNISLDKIKNTADEISLENNIDIRNAVNKLPEKLKTVYILSRIEGYKYTEIAELCNISVKTVEKRMSHVFDFLKKLF